MKIENIKASNLSLDSKNKYYKLLTDSDINYNFNNKNILSFELKESNEAFANGIRRVFNDELEVKALDIKPQDIETDDKFILPDLIRERINLLAFPQSVPNKFKDGDKLALDSYVFQLRLENQSEDIIKVYAKDIRLKIGSKIIDPGNNFFNQNIQICSLRPRSYLYLNNIHVSKKFGYDNNTHCMGTCRYECINVDFTKSCLDQELTDFKIELCDNSQSSHSEMVSMIYENLLFRLSKFQKLVNDYEIPPDSDSNVEQVLNANMELYIIKNTKVVDLKAEGDKGSVGKASVDDLYEIHVNNEYHTVGNIVCKYVYLLNRDIDLINYKLVHILKHKIIIIIKHPEYKKIINKSVDNFINDLTLWKKTLLSNLK
jgi:DNA-directed RNA polymerase subunit L